MAAKAFRLEGEKGGFACGRRDGAGGAGGARVRTRLGRKKRKQGRSREGGCDVVRYRRRKLSTGKFEVCKGGAAASGVGYRHQRCEPMGENPPTSLAAFGTKVANSALRYQVEST